MARIHGRDGRLYISSTSGGVAVQTPYIESYSLELSTDKTDVTAMGDAGKVYVAGLPDGTMSFSGFYDTTGMVTYAAAVDGLSRKFYLYPSANNAGTYFFGTGFFDTSIDSSVSDAVKISGTMAAASAIGLVQS